MALKSIPSRQLLVQSTRDSHTPKGLWVAARPSLAGSFVLNPAGKGKGFFMNCQNCGNAYSSGTTFCANCGKAVNAKKPNEKKKVIRLTLVLAVLTLSLVGNAALATILINEKQVTANGQDELAQCQGAVANLSGFSTDVTAKVVDVAVAEHDLSQESFRMLGDCYEGLAPRESDFERISQKYVEAQTSWDAVSEYLDSLSSSTTTN